MEDIMQKVKVIILLYFLLILMVLFINCTIKPQIKIINYGVAQKETLIIIPKHKSCDFGCIFLSRFFLSFKYSSTKIQSISLYNDERLVWEISATKEAKGSLDSIIYGDENDDYKQIYPKKNKKPEQLIKNNKYRIKINFSGKILEKEFIYYPSEIYLELE